jgi:hypothetical protein
MLGPFPFPYIRYGLDMAESYRPERRPPAEEQAKWDAILANEGMPSELESTSEEIHTPAFEAGVSELYVHYATSSDYYGAHRQALELVRSRVKAGGGTDEELEQLSEDFARQIEDAVTDLQKSALEYTRAIASARPLLAAKPDAITKLVVAKLKQDTKGAIADTALEALAQKAAGTLH